MLPEPGLGGHRQFFICEPIEVNNSTEEPNAIAEVLQLCDSYEEMLRLRDCEWLRWERGATSASISWYLP